MLGHRPVCLGSRTMLITFKMCHDGKIWAVNSYFKSCAIIVCELAATLTKTAKTAKKHLHKLQQH
jgi:hypothetical protein